MLPLWQVVDHYAWRTRLKGPGEAADQLYQGIESWEIAPWIARDRVDQQMSTILDPSRGSRQRRRGSARSRLLAQLAAAPLACRRGSGDQPPAQLAGS